MDTQGISKPLRQIALLPKLIKPSAHYFMKAADDGLWKEHVAVELLTIGEDHE